MLEILRKLAGKPASAAAIRAALAEVEAAADRAAADHAEANEAVRAAVLAGDEKAVDRAETKRAEAARQMDRAEIAAADLRRRIAEAERAEAADALDNELDDVRREADAVRRALIGPYVKATEAIVATLRRLGEAEERIAAVNVRLSAVGRHAEVLPEIEASVWPPLPGLMHVRAADVAVLKAYRDEHGVQIPGAPAGWPE